MAAWTLYKTANLELAVEAMHRRNERSIVKKFHRNLNRVFLRSRQLRNVRLYPWQWAIETYQLEAWLRDGGVLIDTQKEYRPDWRIGEFEAVLFVEAPIDYLSIELYAKNCTREVIVFRPPTWKEHEQQVAMWKPAGYDLDRALQLLRERSQAGPSETTRAIMRAAGVPCGDHMFLASDRELADELDTDGPAVSILRARILQWARNEYHPPFLVVIPRLKPDNEEYVPLFKYIEAQPEWMHGQRYLQVNKLRDFLPSFKRAIRTMAREGWVEQVGFWHIWDLDPSKDVEISLIDRTHRQGVQALQHLKSAVDQAPSYPLEIPATLG